MRIANDIIQMLPTFCGQVIRMISSFVLSKYIAIRYGPAGVALLGQFINLTSVLSNFSTGAIDNGVVRNVAVSKGDNERLGQTVSLTLQIVLVLSVVVTIVACSLAKVVSRYVFVSDEYEFLVIAMGGSVVVFGPLYWLIAGLNGLGKIRVLGFLQALIAGGVVAALVAARALRYSSLASLLVLQCLSQLPALLVACWIGHRSLPKPILPWSKVWPWQEYALYLRFSLMSLATAIVIPVTSMLVRRILIGVCSYQQAGIYEAINRVSNVYLGLLTSMASIYFLPRLSAAKDLRAQAMELRGVLTSILPLAVGGGVILFIFRDEIFALLFSSEFSVASGLLALQVIGDTIRIASRAAAYYLVAHGSVLQFVLIEVIPGVLRVSLTAMCAGKYGLVGAAIAYIVASSVSSVMLAWFLRPLLALLLKGRENISDANGTRC